MFTKKFPIILFVVLIIITQLACNLSAKLGDARYIRHPKWTLHRLSPDAGSGQHTNRLYPHPWPAHQLPTASATNLPISQTPVPVSRCDAMQFLRDVTYPDGSLVTRNNTFVKIWRIKNIGTCSWTPSYALVFTDGDHMGGPSAVALSGNVDPGETIEIGVTLTAPNKDGNYRGYWKLRNASGVLFGFGAQADTAFWVDVKVTGTAYMHTISQTTTAMQTGKTTRAHSPVQGQSANQTVLL